MAKKSFFFIFLPDMHSLYIFWYLMRCHLNSEKIQPPGGGSKTLILSRDWLHNRRENFYPISGYTVNKIKSSSSIFAQNINILFFSIHVIYIQRYYLHKQNFINLTSAVRSVQYPVRYDRHVDSRIWPFPEIAMYCHEIEAKNLGLPILCFGGPSS